MPAVANRDPGRIATPWSGTPLLMTTWSGNGIDCCSKQLISMKHHRGRGMEEKPRVPPLAVR